MGAAAVKRPLSPVALGLLQGPGELLPISSSAHARILGGGDVDKALEVALHAGSLAAFLANFSGSSGLSPLNSETLRFAAATVAPPAVAVLLGQRFIEERLGTRKAMAVGLLAGSAAMLAAPEGGTRNRTTASLTDAVLLGLAQAAALAPGVSRSAATLSTARARGFTPDDAAALSREALIPILAAATARKAPSFRLSHLPGALAAAGSTALALRLVTPPRNLKPLAAYRTALAIVLLWEDRPR